MSVNSLLRKNNRQPKQKFLPCKPIEVQGRPTGHNSKLRPNLQRNHLRPKRIKAINIIMIVAQQRQMLQTNIN